MLTLTGLVFIPLCLLALAAGLRAQLAALGMGAVLSSASVLNLASFGIQPGYFMGLLVLAGAGALALRQGGYRLDRAVLVRVAPLALLLVLSLHALFWANAVFWDKVWVVSGRQMFDLAAAERYSFRAENVNQFVYLLLNALLSLVLADRLARLPTPLLLRAAHAAIGGAFALASFFVAWDWAAHHFGWYFPEAFLHSNAFYAAAHTQSFGDIARVSGPFPEPSLLAWAYGGFLAYASACYLADRRARSLARVLVAVAALAVSTSTTAYAVLALWAGAWPLALVWARRRTGAVRLGARSRWAVAALVLLAGLGAAQVARSHRDDLLLIYDSSIAGKTQTDSYKSRTGADRMGLESFGTTWGLGLGLGSHRANSLPVSLLADLGLAGTLAFVAFIGLCLYRPGGEPWPGQAQALWPLRAFTLGLLVGHCVSNPVINSYLLWLSLTLNLAVTAHRATAPRLAGAGRLGR